MGDFDINDEYELSQCICLILAGAKVTLFSKDARSLFESGLVPFGICAWTRWNVACTDCIGLLVRPRLFTRDVRSVDNSSLESVNDHLDVRTAFDPISATYR